MPGPDHLAHLATDATATCEVLRTADPDSHVAACPEWALRDLALHLGQVHRWATEIVRTGDRQRTLVADVPDGGLADWLAEGADVLHRTLEDAGPDRPCWTFAGTGTAQFWRRRQALETVVHRVDAELAAGSTVGEVPDDLAEDGVGEVVDVLHPRQVTLGRTPHPATGVTLVSQSGRSWELGATPTRAVLQGPAGDLLLVLWRRLPRTAPGLQATGDLRTLDDLLASALTP